MTWFIILAIVLLIGFVILGRYYGFEFSGSDSDDGDYTGGFDFTDFFD